MYFEKKIEKMQKYEIGIEKIFPDGSESRNQKQF